MTIVVEYQIPYEQLWYKKRFLIQDNLTIKQLKKLILKDLALRGLDPNHFKYGIFDASETEFAEEEIVYKIMQNNQQVKLNMFQSIDGVIGRQIV